jgi:hypothetical protein
MSSAERVFSALVISLSTMGVVGTGLLAGAADPTSVAAHAITDAGDSADSEPCTFMPAPPSPTLFYTPEAAALGRELDLLQQRLENAHPVQSNTVEDQ